MTHDTSKWSEPELLRFLEEREKESIYLDYKGSGALGSSDRKKRELSKDVSAFANSAGGRLIYGVAEDGHLPTGLDGGIDPEEISKEWLEQVIGSLIHRRISGIRIHQIDLESSAPGKVAYILEIPQSNLAPHQAADKRFYKRFNFESVPMEEYEIRDVFLRGDGPDLKLSISMELEAVPDSDIPKIRLSPFMENLSSVPSEYSSVSLFIDEKLEVRRIGSPFKHHETTIYHVGEESVLCNHYHRYLHPPSAIPIFEGIRFNIMNSPFEVLPPEKGEYLIGSRVCAGRMTPRFRVAAVAWHEDTWKLIDEDNISDLYTEELIAEHGAEGDTAKSKP